MSETADVVVVGGGINGVSAAYHLAKLGVENVVLLEKDFLAAGGTGKSAAIVRMHYDNRPEAELAWAAYPTFKNWNDVIGHGACDFVQTGLLIIPGYDEQDKLRANIAMQQDVGIKTELIDGEAVREMFPALYSEDVTIAGWESVAGYADASGTVHGIAEAARELGVDVRQGVAVTGINASDSRVTGVVTSEGEISCPNVLLATGYWTVALVKLLGIELPITSTRTQVVSVKRPPKFASPPPHPTIIDYDMGMYCRPETGNMTIGGVDEGGKEKNIDPDDYKQTVDNEFIGRMAEVFPRRLPFMEQGLFMGGWTGPLDITPDAKAILDQVGPAGLYVAAGCSGHGFKTGPAVGQCMAERIAEGQAETVDITSFRFSRYAEGKPLVGEHPYSDTPGQWDIE